VQKNNKPRVTSIDLMFIEELEEDEVVEAQTMQKDVGEENIVEVENNLSIEVQMEVQQSTKV
jgi:hypothetical protein